MTLNHLLYLLQFTCLNNLVVNNCSILKSTSYPHSTCHAKAHLYTFIHRTVEALIQPDDSGWSVIVRCYAPNKGLLDPKMFLFWEITRTPIVAWFLGPKSNTKSCYLLAWLAMAFVHGLPCHSQNPSSCSSLTPEAHCCFPVKVSFS